MSVKVTRIVFGNDHDDAKWIVLQGEIDGVPQVTKRRAINVAGLVSGAVSVDSEKARLVLDVEEYYARWLAVNEALKSL